VILSASFVITIPISFSITILHHLLILFNKILIILFIFRTNFQSFQDDFTLNHQLRLIWSVPHDTSDYFKIQLWCVLHANIRDKSILDFSSCFFFNFTCEFSPSVFLQSLFQVPTLQVIAFLFSSCFITSVSIKIITHCDFLTSSNLLIQQHKRIFNSN